MKAFSIKTSALVVSSSVVLIAAAQAQSQGDYHNQLDNVSKQIKVISRRLNSDKAQLKTQQDKLFKVEKKISRTNLALAKSQQEIKTLEQSVAQLADQITKLKREGVKDREALAKLVRQQYTQASPSYLKMVLNQENPYAVGRLHNYYRYFSRAQQAKLVSIRQQSLALAELSVSRKTSLDTLQKELAEQAALREQLSKSKKTRTEQVTKLAAKVSQGTEQLDKLKADRGRLNKLVRQLELQAEELKRIDAQRRANIARQQQTPNTQSKRVNRPLVEGGFVKQKGRLQIPVSGTRKYRFGSRLAASGMRAEGTFFSTQGSVSVHSIFRGRVLFADFLKGYGLLLIIDHGDEHISLYGHNELLYKKVGDMVDTNEVVAKTGVTGGLKSPGLYFEIRQNATPVDPGKWVRI